MARPKTEQGLAAVLLCGGFTISCIAIGFLGGIPLGFTFFGFGCTYLGWKYIAID